MAITIFLWSVMMTFCLAAIPDGAGAETMASRVAVAKVNGKVLFMDQLEPITRVQRIRLPRHGASHPEREKDLQRRAIEQLIDVELLAQQARNTKVSGLEEMVNDRIARLRRTRPATFTEKTETEIRMLLIDEILVETYLQEKGVADPVIPEAEIRALYEKGEASFRTEEAVRLRHISILLSADTPPAQRTDARGILRQARQRILAGAAFEDIAEDTLRVAGGSWGELGLLTRRDMPEEIAIAAFVLDKGQISDVIGTPSGVHLISMLERQPARTVPYEEVRDFLRKYLQEGRRRQVYQNLVQSLRRQAEIEILSGPG